MAAPADVTVGIDVTKAQLDVAVQPMGTTWTVPRARGGLRRLQGQLEALRPTRIVLEASGGYERAVVAALSAAGLPVVVVNPRRRLDQSLGSSAVEHAAIQRRWALAANPLEAMDGRIGRGRSFDGRADVYLGGGIRENI